MIERRSYIAESIISPGCAVIQGSAENKVAAPGAGGAGAFVGVYPFEDNQAATPDSPIGIAVAGIVPVLAGGTVTAGNRSALKSDRSGSFVNVASTAGQHPTCGTFLQSGVAGEYVDMIVERGTVTIATGGTGGEGSSPGSGFDPATAQLTVTPTADQNDFPDEETDWTWTELVTLLVNKVKGIKATLGTAVQNTLKIAGLALNGNITAAQLKTALAYVWSDIGSKPTTVSGFGITDAYTKTQVDTAIAAIVGAGFIPVAEPAATKSGYKRIYLPNAHEIVIDMSPDQQISAISRSETSNALARILFKDVIYTIPAGGGTISTSADNGFSWQDGAEAPGLGNNARAFVRNGKIVLVSTNIDTAGVAGNAGDIFPAYESSDGINWTVIGVPTGTKALTTVCLTNTGRLIACCNDGTESTVSDDGAVTWTAGVALPSALIGSDQGSYNFSCQIVNNPNFPTRICFVANLTYPAANRGITRVAYSDDNGDSWAQGPNAPGSYKQGQCVHIKSNGTLICVNVVANAGQGRSVDGGASWVTTPGSGQSNTTNPQGLWIDDGTTWGIFLIKNGNAKTTRMTVNGGTSWIVGPDLPSTSGPYWQGPDNDSIFANGATIKFLGGASTWLFSTEKVLLLDPPADYINISDFKALVAGATDWAAFQTAVAAL